MLSFSFIWRMFLSANRHPPRIKSGAGFRRNMRWSIGRRERRPDHLLDPARAGDQHDEAIEAERAAARLRHRGEGRQEVFVDRIADAIAALHLGHLALEPPALLG